MVALFTDTQLELQSVIAAMASGGVEATRQLLDGNEASRATTDELITGFSGVGIAEELGGHGGTLVDAVVMLHALGRALQPDEFAWHLAGVHAAAALGAGLVDEAISMLAGIAAKVEDPSPWRLRIVDLALQDLQIDQTHEIVQAP